MDFQIELGTENEMTSNERVKYRRPWLFVVLVFTVLTIRGLKNREERGKTVIFSLSHASKSSFSIRGLRFIRNVTTPVNSEGNLYIRNHPLLEITSWHCLCIIVYGQFFV